MARESDQPLERAAACRTPPSAALVWSSLDEHESRLLRDALGAGLWTSGAPVRWAKREGASYTFLGELATARGPRRVVVKRIQQAGGLVGALRRAAGRTKALRQAHGAAMLARIGVRTSPPLLVLRGEEDGRHFEWLVLSELAGTDLLRALAQGMEADRLRTVAQRAGELVATISAAGLQNRDHKLSNQILGPDGAIGVIDTVGVRPGGGGAAIERMLVAMLREARGAGVLPDARAMARCVRAATGPGWRAVLRRLVALEVRLGDTTPRVSPLTDAG